jgi:thiamine biosynthesis lipoprotein
MRPLTLIICLGLILAACQNQAEERTPLRKDQAINGQTMGTTYSVKYDDAEARDFSGQIDSTLVALNQEVSTYIPSSVISQFNQSIDGISIGDEVSNTGHFAKNLALSLEFSRETAGAFQPTLMPLVNYWGFGYTEKRAITQVDSSVVDSLMQFVGLDKIRLQPGRFSKTQPGVQLDFSAIAKGYGVDLIAELLEQNGISNYFIEIGGEARAKGQSARGDAWKVGINVPDSGAGPSEFVSVAPLVDQAIATSGNYRNYYEVAGEKYGHTINPQSGFPEKNNLLSASVFAINCATADAFATAFMVMGFEKAMEKVSSLEQVEAYFIVGNTDGSMQTHYSAGLNDLFKTKN